MRKLLKMVLRISNCKRSIFLTLVLMILAVGFVNANIHVYNIDDGFWYKEDLILKTCNETLNNLPGVKTVEIDKECELKYIQNKGVFDKEINLGKTKLMPESEFVQPSKLVEMQYSDGSFDRDVVKTAYSVWQLSGFPKYNDSFYKAVEWLKKVRNDEEKCWPAMCQVSHTSRTLAYLTLAGMTTENRLVHDGLLWLEDKQNYLEENEVRFIVKSEEEENKCNFSYEKDSSFKLNEDEEKELKIKLEAGKRITVECEEDADFVMKNDESFLLARNNDEFLSYRIPWGCVASDKKWSGCDVKSTLMLAISTDNENRKEAATEWLKSAMRKESYSGEYLRTANPIFDSALYLYAVKNDSEVKKWLKVQQNNDGSWGKNNSYVLTGMSVLALMQHEDSTNFVDDGKGWLRSNRNQDVIDSNPLIFNKIFPTRKYLKTSPVVLNLSKNQVRISNPNYEKISISFMSNNLTLNPENLTLNPNETKNISVSHDFNQDYYAEIIAVSEDINHTIPAFYNKKEVNITPFTASPDNIVLKEANATITVEVTNNLMSNQTIGFVLDGESFQNVTIKGNTTKEVELELPKNEMNVFNIQIEGVNKSKEVKVINDISKPSDEITGAATSENPIWANSILWVLVAFVLIGGSYGGYAFVRKNNKKEDNKTENVSQYTEDDFEENEILEMINIAQQLNTADHKTDEELIEELKQQGFKEEEILKGMQKSKGTE